MKNTIFIIICLICLGYTVIFSFEKINTTNTFVWFEAEDAKEIISPLKIIEDNDASGGKAVDNSLIPSHKIEAYLKYNPNIPLTANYNFWARCKWTNECANTFLVKINNYNRVEFGNDPYFNIWHWVKANGIYELHKGLNELSIWNEEANTKIDRLLLTTDNYYIPYGLGEECNYVVNFNEGKIPFTMDHLDKWEIVMRDSLYGDRTLYLNRLEQKEKESAILPTKINSRDFYMSTQLKWNKDVSLIFNMKDQYMHKFQMINGSCRLVKIINGQEIVISESVNITNNGDFTEISIIRLFPEIVIKQDGLTLHRCIDSSFVSGNVGFESYSGNVYVDNFKFITNITPVFNTNFWEHKTKLSDWIQFGYWQSRHRDIQFLEGRVKGNNKYAMYITGEHYFKDYSITCAAKLKKDALGICFYLQDTNNYYMLKWVEKNNRTSIIGIIKVENGYQNLLQQKEIKYTRNKWFRFNISILNSDIRCYFDNKIVFAISDSTFMEGKIAFWTNAKEFSNGFDDLIIEPTQKFIPSLIKSKFVYNFEIRLKVALDKTDWDFSSPGLVKGVSAGLQTRSTKHIFEDLYMENRRRFSNRFSISILEKLPAEVDNYIKVSQIGNKDTEYIFLFRNKKLILIKNGIPLMEKQVKSNRNNIKLVHNNKWEVYDGNVNVLNLKSSMNNDSVKIGVGYKGPGWGHIFINNITIENL